MVPIYLDPEVHVLSAAHHDIAIISSHFHNIRYCVVILSCCYLLEIFLSSSDQIYVVCEEDVTENYVKAKSPEESNKMFAGSVCRGLMT